MDQIVKKRIYFIFACIIVLLVLLAIRLFFIQIIGAYEYQSTYTSQHTGSLSGIGYRGTIFDRKGTPLTNTKDKYIYLVEKTKLNEESERLLATARANQITVDSHRYAAFQAPEYIETVALRLQQEYNAFVFSTTSGSTDDQLAAHLIGYLNRVDNSGAFGLERKFNEVLYSDQELYLLVDAVGRILPGYGVERRGLNAGGSLYTTLDTAVQQIVEENFLAVAQRGSVTVIDIKSGQLLAGASFPSYNPNDVGAYLESDEDELRNRMLQSSYPPGSTFKMITAAAAIEYGVADLDTEFTCTGAQEVNGITIKCSKEIGHGTINLLTAFAQSCNCAFIQLGQMIDAQKLLTFTESFGVGSQVLDVLPEETRGVLPTLGDLQGAGIGNFSIGQGRLEMSCLQVTKMTAIMANGGKDPNVYLIEEALDANGNVVSEKEPETVGKGAIQLSRNRPIISSVTANKVKRLMKEAVLTGTAKRITHDVAGKTGSAQSIQSGKKVVHGWFTGYFPTKDPQYAVTVFVENGGGASPAVTIFDRIAAAMDCPKKEVSVKLPDVAIKNH